MNPKSNLPSRRQDAGFALIASLTIMAFLVLIGVALYSLSSVATRSAEVAAARTKAQANARMALMVALGDLQKNLGPDQRISARSLTLAQHPNFTTPVDIEPDSANAWWVGVSSTVKIEDSDEIEELESGKSVVWLLTGLNPNESSDAQLGSGIFPSLRRIPMFGQNSIDLSLTGGESIEAGAVPIYGDTDTVASGTYAYFVDDNGMKAKLSAENPQLLNTDETDERLGGTSIPGSYDISVLEGMESLIGTSIEDYSKLFSLEDIALLGGDSAIAKNKRLAYTISSFGVLADVKKGGLKKDLTIAFENYEINEDEAYHPQGGSYPNWPVYPVFEQVFGQFYDDSEASDDDWGDYLVVDESKRDEFGANGYIHWAIFRDYYNLKRHIRNEPNAIKGNSGPGPLDYLDPSVLATTITSGGHLFGKGLVPPHLIGPDGGGQFDNESFEMGSGSFREGLPYGNYRTFPNTGSFDKEFLQYYKHSPILPVMSKMQINAWLDQGDTQQTKTYLEGNPEPADAIKTNTQAFVSYYNPYNIGLRYQDANNANRAFAVSGFPYVAFYLPNNSNEWDFVEEKRGFAVLTHQDNTEGWWSIQASSPGSYNNYGSKDSPVFVSPGHALTTAITEDTDIFKVENSGAFDYAFVDLIDKRIFHHYALNAEIPMSLDLDIHIITPVQFQFGIQNGGFNGGYKVNQIHFAPFAQEEVLNGPYGGPGIILDVPTTGLGPNSRGSFSYRLRSATETGSDGDSVRPLVDANIRGFFINPRWDSPLDLDTSAAYVIDNDPLMDQVPQMLTATDGNSSEIGFTLWGAADYYPDGYDRVILFDIPRKDLVSLGQLQHANAGRFSYEPSYIVGNSYANPRIPKAEWKATVEDEYATVGRGFRSNEAIVDDFDLYDASYLVNEAIWDSFIFTTIPQKADNYNDSTDPDPTDPDPTEEHFADLLSGNAALPNARYLPYEPTGSSFDKDTLQTVGDADNLSAFHYNAGHLLVDGPFNVNSTSVDAWEAFLSGTYGMPYQKLNEEGKIDSFVMPDEAMVRFPRVQSVFGGPMTTASPDENYWVGYRALEQAEVRNLALEIVNQVKARGPFLSLGDFVNRKLEDGVLGEEGALQAALDTTVNTTLTGYDAPASHPALPAGSSLGAGFPGQLLQGDILQALSPFMTVRSDTFTIRAYGETLDSTGGQALAKVWCEAIVQRYPDPVDPDVSAQYLSELAEPSSPSGREFRIVSFRWLSEDEI